VFFDIEFSPENMDLDTNHIALQVAQVPNPTRNRYGPKTSVLSCFVATIAIEPQNIAKNKCSNFFCLINIWASISPKPKNSKTK